MPEKRETLEDVAKREADSERERQQAREQFVKNREALAKAVPERFFTLATELREAVKRFNGAATPERRLTWQESTALAARDPNLQNDFSLEFGRPGARVQVGLNAMTRSGGPDVFLIEASGEMRNGSEPFFMRVEGWVEKTGKISWRISVNFKRMAYPIDELAERLVMCAVKSDVNVIFK